MSQERIEKAWEKAVAEGRVYTLDIGEETRGIGERRGQSLSSPSGNGRDRPLVPSPDESGEGNMLLPSLPERSLIAEVITEIMRPVMETIGKMLENNTAALEQLSSAQAIQNDRLEALEKQIRLQTPVTSKQAGYLNEAIRRRSRELLDKSGLAEDKKAVSKLGGIIRKAVLSRYGVGNLREIPKHEYTVAMSQIEMWSNVMLVRDVVRGAKGV